MNTYDKFKKKKGNILVIGDTHIPFELPGYLKFCKDIYKKYNCTRVVHIGDEMDNHAISYHEADPDGLSAGDELELSLKRMKAWYKAFPEALVCVGNHTALPHRKRKTVGLPKRFFKSYKEFMEAPKGWEWGYEFVLDGVLFKHHPTGGATLTGMLRGAERNRMSTVAGHTHTQAGVSYSANAFDTIFALAVGCGIDKDSYAFEYGREFQYKPLIGCGVVHAGGRTAEFVPANLGKKSQHD